MPDKDPDETLRLALLQVCEGQRQLGIALEQHGRLLDRLLDKLNNMPGEFAGPVGRNTEAVVQLAKDIADERADYDQQFAQIREALKLKKVADGKAT